MQSLSLPSFAKVVDFVKCEGKEHLKQFNDVIIAKGGEGVVLREPGSMYISGRTTCMQKYKLSFDAEVKVLKNQYPQGFHCQKYFICVVNSVLIFSQKGNIIYVPITKELLGDAKKIKEGSIITVKHSGIDANGSLMFPQFYRERKDVKWQSDK